MPKNENTPKAPENSDAKEIQKWSVWTQGPKDAKETKRKFKQVTPGQTRDYKYLVKNRKMQRYEEVSLTAEDAPTMSAGTGGFSSNPEKSGVDGYDPLLGGKTTKIYRRKPRLPVDGRTKGYKEAVKRILDRNTKKQQQEIAQRLSQFGVSSNPFQKEETEMSKKYFKTKEGSVEAAVLTSVTKEVKNEYNINSDKPTLTLPKNRYLETKKGSLEEAVVEALVDEKNTNKLPRQLKDPKKEKMVGVKDKKGKVHTVVVDRDNPKYKNAPEHESYEMDENKFSRGKKRKKNDKSPDDDETLKKFDDVDKEDDEDEDAPKGKKDKLPPWLKRKEKKDKDEIDEVSLGHREPSPGSDSTDSYHKLQNAKRKAKAAGKDYDKLSYGDQQKYHEEEKFVSKFKEVVENVFESSPPKGIFPKSDSQKHRERMQAIKDAEKRLGVEKDKVTTTKTPHGTQRTTTYKGKVKIGEDKPKWGSQLGDDGPKKTPHSQFGDSPAEIKKNKKKYFDWQKKKQKEETEIDELSKGTLGRYVKKASVDKSNTGITLGQTSASGKQTQADVQKHAGKMIKRQKGIDKAVDKLSKEEAEIDETTIGWGKSKQIKKMKFGPKSGGVKKGNLKDLEKHNKDLRAKKEEVEVDEQHPAQHKSGRLKKGWKMTASGEPIRVQSNPSMVSRKKARDIESGKVNPDKVDYNKKEEVEVDEVNKHQARAFGSALIRDKSPLDSPKAKAAREKLQKVMKDIKKKDPDHPAVQNVKEEEVEEGTIDITKLSLAQRRALKKTHKIVDGNLVKKRGVSPSKPKSWDQFGKYASKAYEEVEIDELSNKTMDSYAQKASASQADAEKKGDYKKADKRIFGKLRATRRKFSSDTDRILKGLKKESKEAEAGERDVGSDAYADYVANITPGEGITNKDAKKADVSKKKELAYNAYRSTKVDETVEISEIDDELARAMKAREKLAYAKQQQKAAIEHKRRMDRLGNRTSRKEKSSGIAAADANLSQKEEVEVEEEVKFKVKLTGLPVFYVDGKSVGEIKQNLRKKLKRPNDDIESIERVTTTAVKKDFRSRVSGNKDRDMDGEVDEIYSPKKDQSYYDDNEKFKKKNPEKVSVLKPSLKGMPKNMKAIVRARRKAKA